VEVAKLQEISQGKMKHVEMKQNNNLNAKKKKNNNNRYVITSATIFTLAIIAAAAPSTLITTPAAATTMTTSNTTTSASGGLELSPQPVWEEVTTDTGMTPINETHIVATFSGNGTLNLPNGTEAINITSTGSVIASIVDGTAVGEEVISTVDGTESATQKFFGIARFNMEDDTAKAIVIALVHTNSTTGRLAPLNGMIIVGTHEDHPNTPMTTFRFWEWQSGIPLPTGSTTATATTTPEELSPQMHYTTTTTTTTNPTITDDDAAGTNTTTIAATPEEEVGGEEEQQQQQQQ
jgi:hypothetical protein